MSFLSFLEFPMSFLKFPYEFLEFPGNGGSAFPAWLAGGLAGWERRPSNFRKLRKLIGELKETHRKLRKLKETHK